MYKTRRRAVAQRSHSRRLSPRCPRFTYSRGGMKILGRLWNLGCLCLRNAPGRLYNAEGCDGYPSVESLLVHLRADVRFLLVLRQPSSQLLGWWKDVGKDSW
jgi:hypothetical protein